MPQQLCHPSASPPVYRFAPSPNGPLHLGHAYAAIVNFDRARAAGGRFLLRIENIDQTRCRSCYEQAIYDDLAWLGLSWEMPVRRQSDHFDEYREALDRLQRDGLLYAAFESRGEIAQAVRSKPTALSWPCDPDGTPLYPGPSLDAAEIERRRRSTHPYALRLHMDRAIQSAGPLQWKESGAGPNGEAGIIVAQPERWGDVILGRKEIPASYHLAVVMDDAAQGVTDVVRGHDLFHATSVHRLLQALLDLPTPRYHHHRLICDAHGRKLAKSTGAPALATLRERGLSADDVRAMLFAP